MAKKKPATDEADVYVQSAVNLLKTDWRLLRRVADARADVKGGRRSVLMLSGVGIHACSSRNVLIAVH